MPSPSRPTGRLVALDGVRGVAAVIVVLYHVSLLAQPFAESGTARVVWEAATESPLKLGFAGTEAVQVFFVLSGLVMTLAVRQEAFSWPGYYVSRLLRLYVPVWGAIALTLLLVVVVPRDPSRVTADAWISDANITTPDWLLALQEATLTPASYDVVNTLWSLRWELLFSVLLPLFVGLAVLWRRWAWPVAALCALAMIAGRVLDERPFDLDALVYLPTFLVGCLIAVRLDDITAWAQRRRRTPLWAALGASSLALLVLSWVTRPYLPQITVLRDALWGLAGTGAAGLILFVVCSQTAQRVMDTRVTRWLGEISFSLYLVHAPLLATLAYVWGDDRWMLVGAVGVPLSIVVAWAFFWGVERPAHRLSRAAGARVRAVTASWSAVSAGRARATSAPAARADAAPPRDGPGPSPEPTPG